MKKINNNSLFILLTVLMLISCSVNYSLSGVTLPEEIKTIKVSNLLNNSGIIDPILSANVSDKIREVYIQRTPLQLTSNDIADLKVSGVITSYSVSSVAIQGNDLAGLNRLTISVDIKFENTKNSEKNFKKSFSRYQDFEANKSLSEVSTQLIEEIGQQLANDIFNASLSDW